MSGIDLSLVKIKSGLVFHTRWFDYYYWCCFGYRYGSSYKTQALKLNESSIRNELQDELRKIEETYPEEVDVPDVSPSLNTLIQNQDESHQQEEQLPPSPPTSTIPAAEQQTPTMQSELPSPDTVSYNLKLIHT